MSYDYIIFDNDGVNINSEDTAMRIMDDWGIEFIRTFSPNADIPTDYIYSTYPGTSTDKIVRALITTYELSLSDVVKSYNLVDVPEKIEDIGLALAALVTAETIRRFKTELTSVPGTSEALPKIIQMFGQDNVALMTTSPADRMKASLEDATNPITGENAGLGQFFPEGPQRRSGYGHDNKYDEGFAALGWDPNKCIIVEDSKSGVEKAKKGRDKTAVIGTVAARFFTHKKAQADILLDKGANIVISSMSDLPIAAQYIREGNLALLAGMSAPYFLPEAAPYEPNRGPKPQFPNLVA